MKRKIKLGIMILLSSLLVASIIWFIALNSFTSVINDDTIGSILDNFANDTASKNFNLNDEELTAIKAKLNSDCAVGKSASLDFSGGKLEFDCQNIKSVGNQELKDLLILKVKNKILELKALNKFINITHQINLLKWFFAVSSIALIIGIIIVS